MKGLRPRLGLIRRQRRGGIPPFVPSDANVAAYFAAGELAGAVFNVSTKEALDTFVVGMKSAGIWPLVRRWNPMLTDAGSTLAGVSVVLNDTVGAAGTDTLNNYVLADWDPLLGLHGNLVSTYIETGWSPLLASTEANGFVGVCYRGAAPTTPKALGGVTNAGVGTVSLFIDDAAPTYSIRGVYGPTAAADVMTPVIATGGNVSMNRASSTDLRAYIDNANEATQATPPTLANSARSFVFGAFKNNASFSAFLGTNERIAGYILADALNSTQRGTLQTLWAAFNTAIGR